MKSFTLSGLGVILFLKSRLIIISYSQASSDGNFSRKEAYNLMEFLTCLNWSLMGNFLPRQSILQYSSVPSPTKLTLSSTSSVKFVWMPCNASSLLANIIESCGISILFLRFQYALTILMASQVFVRISSLRVFRKRPFIPLQWSGLLLGLSLIIFRGFGICYKRSKARCYIFQMEARRKLKIMMASDTHGKHQAVKWDWCGDIFIHAGDFTLYSDESELLSFCDFLDRLQYKHKIVICGNHQINFDKHMDQGGIAYFNKDRKLLYKTPEQAKAKLKQHCILLEHEYIEIEGIRIFGSPFTVHYHDTAFHYQKHEQAHFWPDIPDVDILITHGPPYGILDYTIKYMHAGSRLLLDRVKKMKPSIHVFGHIHENGGMQKIGQTLFINAAQVDRNYDVARKPYIVFYEM